MTHPESTFYTLQFLTSGTDRILKVKVTTRSNPGHTMTMHTYIPNQCPYNVSTSYTLQFLRYSQLKFSNSRLLRQGKKVISGHTTMCTTTPPTNVPTKFQLPTPSCCWDTAQTYFFPLSAHPDAMGENHTRTAIKGCGVKMYCLGPFTFQNISIFYFYVTISYFLTLSWCGHY